jgi:site-specific recombinase XerD
LLAVFIAAKRVEGCSEKSLKYYNATIRLMFDNVEKPVREINTDDLRVYLANYQKERGSSKVTIDNMRRIFSSFFGWLEDEDYILKSPVRRIHKIKADKTIKDTFSDEGLELLRDACEEVRDLAMIDLLASTGMRVGELVGLNREDINFHERECVVFGKGSTERVVYFDARTKIHLMNYLDARSDQNPALFVSLALPHERLMIGGVETRLRDIGKQADMQKVHPHKFRRTLATRAIDKGMPIEQVQRLLGHVKIDTTLHYAMVNQANVRNSHRKFIG